jgi:hypothetical protein
MSVVEPLLAPAPTITVELDTDRYGAKLAIGLPASSTALTVWRVSTATGNLAYIRGWQNTPTTAVSLDVFDWEIPLGVEVVYHASAVVAGADSAVGASSPVVADDDRDWLVDLARPTNTFPITVESLPALSYSGPVGVHRVLDRRDPILTTAALWTPGGTLTFFTGTIEERDRARAILGTGVAILLRTPPDRGVGNLYLGVLNMAEQRVSRLALHDDRRFVVEVVQVARPDPTLYVPLPPLGYDDRLETWPTYQDVVNTGMTYQELAYIFPPGRIDPGPPWPPSDV